MSGGSLDYICFKVEEAAGNISSRAETAEHRAFAAHLQKVAKALHDLEWVWSCDYGRGDEVKAIMACIAPSDVLETATEQAIKVRDELAALIESIGHSGCQVEKP